MSSASGSEPTRIALVPSPWRRTARPREAPPGRAEAPWRAIAALPSDPRLTRRTHSQVGPRPSEDQAAFAGRGRSEEGLALRLPSLSDTLQRSAESQHCFKAKAPAEDRLDVDDEAHRFDTLRNVQSPAIRRVRRVAPARRYPCRAARRRDGDRRPHPFGGYTPQRVSRCRGADVAARVQDERATVLPPHAAKHDACVFGDLACPRQLPVGDALADDDGRERVAASSTIICAGRSASPSRPAPRGYRPSAAGRPAGPQTAVPRLLPAAPARLRLRLSRSQR